MGWTYYSTSTRRIREVCAGKEFEGTAAELLEKLTIEAGIVAKTDTGRRRVGHSQICFVGSPRISVQ
jgi:hypothetical protein